MHTTPQLLDALANHLGTPGYPVSDYRLAKVLSTSTSAVSNWRTGRSHLSGPYALKVADLMTWSRIYVLACVEAERESHPEVRGVWEFIAKKFSNFGKKKAAAILAAPLLGLLMTFFPQHQVHADGFRTGLELTPVCIMRT